MVNLLTPENIQYNNDNRNKIQPQRHPEHNRQAAENMNEGNVPINYSHQSQSAAG